MSKPPPLRRMFDLGELSRAERDVVVSVTGEDLKVLARWAEVDDVVGFGAKIALRRESPTKFIYRADLEADIVQACVVTLEPLSSHISRPIERELLFSPLRRGEEAKPVEAEDGVPEEIHDLHYDLAAPLLEEFSLAIVPYPRKEGVAFAGTDDPESRPKSPFEALKILKERG